MTLSETHDGFALTVTDEAGFSATAHSAAEKQSAQNLEKAETSLRENLRKLGGTDFITQAINLEISQMWFVPASIINSLRRDAIDQLVQTRTEGHQRPPRREPVQPLAIYPEDT